MWLDMEFLFYILKGLKDPSASAYKEILGWNGMMEVAIMNEFLDSSVLNLRYVLTEILLLLFRNAQTSTSRK